MKTSNKFSPEVRERAVHMVQEHRGAHPCRPCPARRGDDVQGDGRDLPSVHRGHQYSRLQVLPGQKFQLQRQP